MFFFFSSRRRHTRYWRDWSSDVCSSDLFDAESGVVTLTSSGLSGEKTETMRNGSAPPGLHEALRGGRVKLIIWDHCVLSRQIVYVPFGRGWVTVGLGMGGVHRFDALTELARRHP